MYFSSLRSPVGLAPSGRVLTGGAEDEDEEDEEPEWLRENLRGPLGAGESPLCPSGNGGKSSLLMSLVMSMNSLCSGETCSSF